MNNGIVFSIAALVTSSLLGCSSNSTFNSGNGLNAFSEIPELMELHGVPGVSIATIKNFKIDKILVFGVKNQNTQDPVTQDTLFQAASMSKSVTAVAAMKMSQNGMIGLDIDINNELVSWSVDENEHTTEEKVTLRRLLSHTAGTTIHGFPGYHQDEAIPSLIEILNGQSPANTAAIVVDSRPGSQFKYSGGGYVLAQQALIDVTQQPFEDLMNENVLEPLGMTNSSFRQFLSNDNIAKVSAGHNSAGQNIFGDYNKYPEMSAAGLWSTPQDLAKFLIELQLSLLNQSNKVLAGEVVEEMITPIVDPEFGTSNSSYGLGFTLWTEGDDEYFGHAGANAGFKSQMIAHRNSGDGAVVMTNGNNGDFVVEEIISFIKKANAQEI